MNSLFTICAGLATVSLAYIAVSLEPIAQQARQWNYCVEHQVAYFIEQEGKEQPWTRPNQVAFCSGSAFKVDATITNIDSLKK